MIKLKEYKNIISELIKLSLPILGGNLSHLLISITDTIVAGRYSTIALGAISVASAIIMSITIGAIGLIISVSPVIANLRGKKQQAKKYFKLTILFAFLVSIPFFIFTEIFLFNINHIGLNQDLVYPVKQYIEICAWSIFPAAIFVALKEFLQAFEKVIYANAIMFAVVIINAILDYILTFGFDYNFIHIAPMGIVGLSVATLVSKIISALLILLYCFPLFKVPLIHSKKDSKKYIKELLKVGTPISCAMFFEFLGFNLTAILIGKFSAIYAAVHNIILCIANFTFMIVMSIASAASIKIGFYNGKKDKENIIKYSIANISTNIVVCIIAFIILSLFSEQIISIFSKDIEVIKLSKIILKFAMLFLFFDGLQGACVGILKGLKDTKIIMFTMLFVYLMVAIPIGCYFAFYKNIVLEGFWCGLAIALFLASIIVSTKVFLDIKKLK